MSDDSNQHANSPDKTPDKIDRRKFIGTAAATAKLIEKLGGIVDGAAFAVELTFLNGRSKLNGLDIFSLIQYDK